MPTGISGLYQNTKGATVSDTEKLWNDIPVGRENAYTYEDLCYIWKCEPRKARAILHALSLYDNGDNYILIRSSAGKGFYKTDDESEIQAYKRECLNRGRNVFAPVKKINRVLNTDAAQLSTTNNLRVIRESRGLKQADVCKRMKKYDRAFDKSLLSKMENGVCLPTAAQLLKLAEIYACEPFDLMPDELYTDGVKVQIWAVATQNKGGCEEYATK